MKVAVFVSAHESITELGGTYFNWTQLVRSTFSAWRSFLFCRIHCDRKSVAVRDANRISRAQGGEVAGFHLDVVQRY